MSDFPRLSVLDLVPVRAGQTSGDAIAASLALAGVADEAGYHRYWVAEHHNMPAVAATNPPVLIGLLASATRRIRVGSGGVMLPNHAPLVVAEQFALLEAAHPGRIDLGLGRAPGTDPVTSWALRHGGGARPDTADRFGEYVQMVLALMAPGGAGVEVGGRTHALLATPSATSVADVWMLGSSEHSAHLAAALGLPYVFAHHFSGSGTEEALAIYRREFRPGEVAAPRTFLTANVCVAPSAEEAEARALPQLLGMLALRTGGPLRPQLTIEDAQKEAASLPESHRDLLDRMRARWIIGEPDAVRERIAAFAERFGVEEVMVHPVAGAWAEEDVRRSVGREASLALLG